MTKLYKTLTYFVLFLFSSIILFLFYFAGTSTSLMNIHETSYFVKDSLFLQFLFVVLFFELLFIIYSKYLKKTINNINSNPVLYQKIKNTVLLFYFVFLIIFILCTQKIPQADQYEICHIAEQWHHHDFISMLQGGYLFVYPNQISTVFLIYLLSFFIGHYNYIVLQFFNVLAVIFIIKCILSLMEDKKPFLCLLVMFSYILFTPLFLYTTFVYGTLIGLALSLYSYLYLKKYLKTENKFHLFFSVLLILLAVWVKNNYLIFLIDELCYLVLEFIKKKRKTIVMSFLLFFSVLLLSNPFMASLSESITHVKTPEGSYKLSWVVMGLMENDMLADGWYNGYNMLSYKNCDYNSKKQKEIVHQDFYELLSKEEIPYYVDFLKGKNLSQWNNPTFQGYWINDVMKNQIQPPPFIQFIMNENHFVSYLNLFQFFILFGTVLYVFLCKNKDEFFFLIVFIGGFLFHTFWEAKCQYTFPYFLLLFPLSFLGFYNCFCKITTYKNN